MDNQTTTTTAYDYIETSARFRDHLLMHMPRSSLLIQMSDQRHAIATQGLLFGIIGSVLFVVACFCVFSRARSASSGRRPR